MSQRRETERHAAEVLGPAVKAWHRERRGNAHVIGARMAAGYDPPSASLHPAGGAGEQDVMQDDLAAILRELGLGDHARPVSPHQVVQTEVLPMIRAWRMALAAAGAPVHESLVHCGPACACGVTDAGMFYRDPLCASRRDAAVPPAPAGRNRPGRPASMPVAPPAPRPRR